MQKITIKEIVEATHGKLLCGSPETEITSVCTNSKDTQKGALFVPIKGNTVDGHDFIPAAADLDAVATFTQKNSTTCPGLAHILVEDCRDALQRLAAYYRDKFSIPVVGVTGSVGKTTTKEIVAAALSGAGCVMKTIGNQNSQIGLPLTIFRLEAKHDFAVVEMGISEFGEMQRLSNVAKVNRAIVTNIGISHIENLKTRENIRAEKLHITDKFDEDSILYLNGSDPLLAALREDKNKKIVYYGFEEWCDYRAQEISTDGTATSFKLISPTCEAYIKIPTIGTHNVLNALAAIAVATDLRIPMEAIQKGLFGYQEIAMRQQVHRLKDVTIIDDTYNASPDSVKSGIDVLKTVKRGPRSIVILGDMLELGEKSKSAHFELGEHIADEKIDVLLTVGNDAKEIANGANSRGERIVTESFSGNKDAINYISGIIAPGDTVLVKGSRGMHMEEIVESLLCKFER